MPVKFNYGPKRKRGQRAKLTPKKVIGAALDVIEVTGLADFSARQVAKRLRVSSAAIFAHVEGGVGGLRIAMVYVTLRDVARPYGPEDTAEGYLFALFVRLLAAIRGRRALAQLIAIELSSDPLVCPLFTERLFAASLAIGKPPANTARVLDFVLATVLGMVMLEGETQIDDKSRNLANGLARRIMAFPPDETPTLLAHRDALGSQISSRLIQTPKLLERDAHRYADPVIAALKSGVLREK